MGGIFCLLHRAAIWGKMGFAWFKLLMKILAISDEVIERLYSVRVRDTYPDVQLIVGCGDLPFHYLEFLLTVFNHPLFYVPGNHDPRYDPARGEEVHGGVNLDGQVAMSKGLLLAGLGGCIQYHPGAPNQYTQLEMYERAYKLLPVIFLKKLRYKRPLDILITHSPPAGIHDDLDDPPHRGLKALNLVIKMTKPRFMLHGHTMFYKHNLKNHITRYVETQVVNVYPFRTMEIEG